LFAPITIAVAYEKVDEEQETPWDFAEDCLVTHVPAGNLNTVTGVAGLVAMLWVYGVAWHQQMGEGVYWRRAEVVEHIPSMPPLLAGVRSGADMIGTAGNALFSSDKAAKRPVQAPVTVPAAGESTLPVDPEVAALVVERKRRLAVLSVEGPRMLD